MALTTNNQMNADGRALPVRATTSFFLSAGSGDQALPGPLFMDGTGAAVSGYSRNLNGLNHVALPFEVNREIIRRGGEYVKGKTYDISDNATGRRIDGDRTLSPGPEANDAAGDGWRAVLHPACAGFVVATGTTDGCGRG